MSTRTGAEGDAMRRTGWAGLAVCGLLLVSCGGGGGDGEADGKATGSAATPSSSSAGSAGGTTSPAPDPAPTSTPTPTPTPTPSASPTFGSDSFAKGDCVALDPTATASGSYRETPCEAPDAVAAVLLREDFDTVKADRCEKPAAEADALIHLTREDPENYGKKLYAEVCLRNLEDPHPGAPGAGGGPNIVKGDCLLERKTLGGSTLEKSVFETACAGTGTAQPLYKVVEIVPLSIVRGAEKKECPANTEFRFAKKREFVGDLYCAVGV
ncbi:hypothetical protein [Streptomyces sp. NPDC051211]|uniref:hypothetical protein n=1 Tax=Streptomyces sp. NPDC051211 TaxID=3154643 RepID=UPI00344CAE4A